LRDQGYFAFIIDRYEQPLTRFIRRISSARPEEIEDLLQEVFLKVYQNLHGFDSDLKFSSWIYRITRNEVISWHRKTKARPKYTFLDHESSIDPFVSDLDIEAEIDTKYLREHLLEVIESLDEKYKEVLVLKFLEQKDYKEISDILKKPTGTIGTLINRAKKQCKKELKKRNITPE